MQRLTEILFEAAPPFGIFDWTAIINATPGRSEGARKQLVVRAVAAGEVERLKKGLFCLAPRYRRAHPHPFVVARLLLSTSHISMESALWHHGLIPEGVREIASATPRRSRSFSNALGEFTYTTVPCDAPLAGVALVEVQPGGWAAIGSPLRAIADLVSSRRDVAPTSPVRFLTESMRMERDELEAISLEGLDELLDGLGSKRTRAFLRALAEEVRR